jgi:hypothetical protein
VDIGLWDGLTFSALDPFSGLGFGEASAGAGVDVGVGTLELGVAPAGSSNPVAAFDVTTAGGLKVFAVAAGSLQNPSLESFRLMLIDTASFPWMKLGEVFPK